MKQYINKSALVAEIEKIRGHIKRLRYAVDANCIVTVRNACECLESSINLLVNSIDTLEVKEEQEEPVSKDLEQAAKEYRLSANLNHERYGEFGSNIINAFIAGAKWQKQQMMKEAVEATVKIDAGGYPYIPSMELYDYTEDKPLAKEGDKVKLIIIKEDLV